MPGVAVDVFRMPGRVPASPLVLVHGVTADGKDDPRLRAAAALLARTGFEVAVPTIPGLAAGRLRPTDVELVVRTIRARPRPTTVVAVSIGAGPALLASADPRVRDQVATVMTLGGYASARELVRFFVTGDYAYRDVRGHVRHDPVLVRAFVSANAELAGDRLPRALARGDAAEAARAIEDLGPDVSALLDGLSPERVAGRIPARLLLVHGRADRAVPYTETLRLIDAAGPGRARATLVGVVDHVEGAEWTSTIRGLRDLLALWGVTYIMIAGR